MRSLNTVQAGIADYLADSDFEVLCKVIRRFVSDAGAAGIAQSVLVPERRACRKPSRACSTAATKWLDNAGHINIRKNEGKGGKGMRYLPA